MPTYSMCKTTRDDRSHNHVSSNMYGRLIVAHASMNVSMQWYIFAFYRKCRHIYIYIYIYILVHKQMYCIRTNLQRFQPSNIKSNIRVLIFHYIMEYFSNLSCSCPLHEQPKDEIILLAGDCTCVPNCLVIRRKHFADNFNTYITIINFMTKVSKINIR